MELGNSAFSGVSHFSELTFLFENVATINNYYSRIQFLAKIRQITNFTKFSTSKKSVLKVILSFVNQVCRSGLRYNYAYASCGGDQ